LYKREKDVCFIGKQTLPLALTLPIKSKTNFIMRFLCHLKQIIFSEREEGQEITEQTNKKN
jgi:hypothetical protein